MADRQMKIEIVWDARWAEEDLDLPFDLDLLEPLPRHPFPIRVLSPEELDEIDREVSRETFTERLCVEVENFCAGIILACPAVIIGTIVTSELLLQAIRHGWL